MRDDHDPGLISILMPTYNVAAYVEEAVNSILAQTYGNFELIIVDDASTDGTFALLQKLQEKDTRIQLYRNEENSKICKTLNRALAHARGGYIARMDGDDVSLPERLEKEKRFLDAHPEVDMVGCDTLSITEQGEILARKRSLHTTKYIHKALRLGTVVTHATWLARRAVFDTLHGYRDIPYTEDYDFLLRGELQGYRYGNVGEALYKVRIRQGNSITSVGLVQYKTGLYVRKLHKREKREKTDLFSEEDLRAATVCTMHQKARYTSAYAYLNAALHERSNKLLMLWDLFLAVCASHCALKLLAISAATRILVRMENKFSKE